MNGRKYQVTARVICNCRVRKSKHDTENRGDQLVHCCGTVSVWFHKEYVEFQNDLHFCDDCKEL
jgi:hypothetical protein